MADYYRAHVTRPKRFSEHLAEAGQRYEARLKSDASVQSLEDDQRLREIMTRSGGDFDVAAREAAAAGISPDKVSDLETRAFGRVERKRKLQDWANADRDREQKRALDRMKLGVTIAEGLESVTDRDSYAAWHAAARDLAKQGDVPFTAPTTFDEGWVTQKREQGRAARRQIEMIAGDDAESLGLPKGTVVWQDKRTGEPKRVLQPRAPAAMRPVEIGDPNSPTGSRYVAPEEAIGKPGKPQRTGRSGGGLTPTQEASNAEVDEARRLVKRLSKEDLIARTRQYTDTGAPNPAYDPTLAATVRKALKRKVGVNDPEFEVVSKQFRGASEAPAPRAPADMDDDELLQSLGLGR